MSDQKTERLINLTLALLATKRYLTKAEIFRVVAGYSGSAETMERMFERDKDELRSMGIEIEVKGLDPLFEDDQGYLIRSESFQLQGNEFSKEELLYLTMAANLWHDSALQNDSKAALLKIQSLSGPIGSDEINTPAIRDNQSSQVLSIAFNAVDKQQNLSFQYKERLREVEPYGLYTRDGFWYLVAHEDRSVKSFKLLRIEGALTTVGKVGGFKKPSDFDLAAFLEHSKNAEISVAHLHVRKEQAFALRSKYATIEIDDEWDLMEVEYNFEQEIIETVLWHGLNVVVVKPENLQKQIISKIKELANG